MRDDTDRQREGKDPHAPRHLRLVHPAPPKLPKAHRSQHPGRLFTPEEQAKLRAALVTARARFGGLRRLARAMEVAENTICSAIKGRDRGFSAALAVRLARVAGVSLDAILRPGLALVKPECPSCGKPDGAA